MYHIFLLALLVLSMGPICKASFISNRADMDVKEEDKIHALENQALIEGDIVPNKNLPVTGDKSNLYHATADRSSKWPKGIVNFKLDKRFYDDEVETILNAMHRIEQVSCIRFRPYKPKINGLDYVKIVKGSGCYSSAGRIGGEQPLSLGRGCVNVGTIQHELLHTIGLFHQHMRFDRDKYLDIHFSNIKKEYKAQFNKLSRKEGKVLTPFDYQSIMIYGNKAFSKNNQPTMTAKVKSVKLTYPFNKTKLTKLDRIAINRLYKCTNRGRKRNSLLFFSEAEDENEDSSEVDFPKLEDILIGGENKPNNETSDEAVLEENEKELNEKLEKERLERERLEKEKLEKERVEKEKLEKNKLAKEKLEKERLEKEKLENEKLMRENLRKEKLLKEKLRKEKLEKERLAKEKLEKERILREKLEKVRLAKEKLEKERLEKEKLEKEKLMRENLEKERMMKEKLEKERLEKEKLEKEKLMRENLEKERMMKEKLEKERLEKEKLEKEKLMRENLEKERMMKEKLEKERLEKEKLAKEKLIKDNLEKERLMKEKLQKEKLIKEKLEKEKQKKAEEEKMKSKMLNKVAMDKKDQSTVKPIEAKLRPKIQDDEPKNKLKTNENLNQSNKSTTESSDLDKDGSSDLHDNGDVNYSDDQNDDEVDDDSVEEQKNDSQQQILVESDMD